MFRVIVHELRHAIPEGRNSIEVFIQTQNKAILLVVFLHESERVKADVAEQFNAGLHTPIVLVVQHQRVPEEEPRFVTTHVSVTLGITVDDFPLAHVLTHLFRLLLIDPLRVRPMFLWNDAIMGGTGNQSRGDLFEFVIKLLIIQEYPIIMVVAIEAIFDTPD